MSSDETPECNEARLERRFQRDVPNLRAAIGDANRDGRLSAGELEAEIKNNPQGPLAQLLRLQAMPALRAMQIDIGAVKNIAEHHLPETLPAASVSEQVARTEQAITSRTRSAVERELMAPFAHVHTHDLCAIAQQVDQEAHRLLGPIFSATPEGKQAVTSDLSRGAMMVRSLNSVELGSVQVLYDHLATDADKALVKSGVDRRVNEVTAPPQAAQKPPVTRC